MQTIGTLCLLEFCKKYSISHHSLEELHSHLLSILKTEQLPIWDENGLNIEITGRGDELPDSLIELIPEELKEDFYELIDSVIEIGVVNLYGQINDLPFIFLTKSLSIINKHNIHLIIPDTINHLESKGMTWGEIISIPKYDAILNFLNNKYGTSIE